ncbi:MAG: GHKL domain-containing protein [Chitinophagaceae bacterium]|nr:GHKL domain-containing protein [Chitinophagaceae bacterium]
MLKIVETISTGEASAKSGETNFTNDIDLLNKMSQLNNELVNTQRILHKKNEEISYLNKKLSIANVNLEQLMYVVSHDLKEPLRMVNSFMLLLKNKYAQLLDEKANTYIGFAVDGGKRMQAMITDLLELSHTAANNSHKELVDVNLLFNEAQQNLFNLIKESKAEIVTEGKLPKLIVNKSDIIRLFQNLVGNAIKFKKRDTHPVITLNVMENKDEWLISIKDNGIGIPAEKFENIFEIFNRLHSKEEYEGTGIGLASCKKIVEGNGGTIWLESEEDIGSTFYFTIPKLLN